MITVLPVPLSPPAADFFAYGDRLFGKFSLASVNLAEPIYGLGFVTCSSSANIGSNSRIKLSLSYSSSAYRSSFSFGFYSVHEFLARC